MITYDQALALLMAEAFPLPVESVPLEQSLGRILRQALVADRPLPPFNRVAMDGFALAASDFTPGAVFEVIGIQAAGQAPTLRPQSGQVIKVMTGAILPLGCDAVVPVEECQISGHQVRFLLQEVSPGDHIAAAGEDASLGQQLAAPGESLTPRHLALAASLGCHQLTCGLALRVKVLSTGDEVIQVTQAPLAWQIRDANGPSLLASLRELGATVEFLGICPDQETELKQKIALGLEADLFILSGGVSAGDFDLVPQLLKLAGVKEIFHQVLIKPGKPVWLGKHRNGFVLGLPGNPVSAQTGFKLFAEPLLLRLAGASQAEPVFYPLQLAAGIKKKGNREHFVPCRLVPHPNGSQLEEVKIQGSGDFSNFTKSQGLVRIAAESAGARAGDILPFLPWRRL